MSEMQPEDFEWPDVDRIIEDLKRDGYQVSRLESSNSDPTEEKAFYLKVER